MEIISFPTAWSKNAKISISLKGGTDLLFGSRSQDVEINEGDRPGRSEPGINGGRVWIDEVQADGTISLKIRPVSVNPADSGGGLFQQNVGGTWDTTDPYQSLTTTATLTRDEFRVAILWTNDPANAGAHLAVTNGTEGLRFYATSCRIVNHSVSFTNGDLVVSVTFKFPPTALDGTRNYEWGSANGGAELTALGAYA